MVLLKHHLIIIFVLLKYFLQYCYDISFKLSWRKQLFLDTGCLGLFFHSIIFDPQFNGFWEGDQSSCPEWSGCREEHLVMVLGRETLQCFWGERETASQVCSVLTATQPLQFSAVFWHNLCTLSWANRLLATTDQVWPASPLKWGWNVLLNALPEVGVCV